MPLFADDNWFIDPFTGTLTPRAKTEVHTVEQFLSFGNRYGIQLDYTILNENPSSVSIAGYTEVGFATPPSAGQFRVDYDPLRADGTSITTIRYKNTAFIEFPASANGTSVTVHYKATGRVVKAQGFADILSNSTIPNNLTIEDDLFVGNVNIGGALVVDDYSVPQSLSIESKLLGLNAFDISLNAQTYNLTGGAQIICKNLSITGNCFIRGNASNVFSIIEVAGNLTLAPSSNLQLIRTLLIVHGNVILASGSATISSPNGANGARPTAGNGQNAVTEFGGLGAVDNIGGAGAGGAGAGGIGNGGLGAGGTNPSGAGGAGGIGAGGGGGSSIGNVGGAGGASNIFIAAGGRGGNSGVTQSDGGGGGGGGAGNVHLVFLSDISSGIIIATGKGGIGSLNGTAGRDSQVGTGGQTGLVYLFKKNPSITAPTIDVTAGTSTGNATRDGSAGSSFVYNLTANSGLVKPLLLANFQYYTKTVGLIL